MLLRSWRTRLAVVGVCALALGAPAAQGLASPAKPDSPRTGTLSPAGGATPLVNGVEQTLTGTEKYVYDQGVIYWSVVAVRSAGGTPTLSLYAEESNKTLLAKSSQKRKRTEFVLVDSNHAAIPSSYFPTANSKGGASTVELDNDAEILFDDEPLPVALTESDIVKMVDVFLVDGTEYVLKVSGDGDAGLYLMRSDPATADTWYQSRADAVATADRKGPGKSEKITITGADDWYGLVLINNSGGGTYTLTKSPS